MHAPRLLPRVVLAVALLLGLGGLVAIPVSPAAAAPGKLAKAPQVYPSWPITGETVTFSGKLGKSVRRIAKLQTRSGGKWRVVAKKTIFKGGKYSFSIAQSDASAQFRVAAPKKRVGSKTYPRKLSKVRTVSPQAQSTIISTVRSVKAGTTARLTMWLSPVRNGRPVAIQRNSPAGWQTVGTAIENGIGQASYDYPATDVGDFEFRAVQQAFNGAPESAGATTVRLGVLPAAPVQVIAHRGASRSYAENTKPAVRNAVWQQADYIEVDLQQTAPDYPDPDGDGPLTAGPRHWVLLHDATLARTTNVAEVFGPSRANDPVGTFTLAEIKQLDAGSWRGAKQACNGGWQNAPSTGDCRIPTLEELIAPPSPDPVNGQILPNGGAILQAEADSKAAGHTVKLVLEHKVYGTNGNPSEMKDLYDRVKELQPTWINDKVTFMSFNYATEFGQFNVPDPDNGGQTLIQSDGVKLAAIVDDATDTVPAWPSAQVHIRSNLVSPATVQPWAAAGTPLIAAWTVNSADAMLAAATSGATAVTTDDIDLARSTLLR